MSGLRLHELIRALGCLGETAGAGAVLTIDTRALPDQMVSIDMLLTSGGSDSVTAPSIESALVKAADLLRRLP